ncbi:MAG: WD40 repeat domain-containing protein [Chloroflexi bacterium]|nr:MAG: WD40 repeat domain-containing protein [Chloroflexota bacterium]
MKRLWLFVFLFIVACNRAEQPTAPIAQVSEETAVPATHTAIPSPTASATPLPTNTPTITPSPTNTMTPTLTPPPTQTPTPELPVGLGTAVPEPLHQLAPENAAQMVELAQYGDGNLLDIQLSQDESTLYAFFSNGLYVYDIETFVMKQAVQTTITKHVNNPYAISTDGAFLAVVNGSEIHVWNVVDGSLHYTFDLGELPYAISDFRFSPNSQSLTALGRLPSGNHLWLWAMSDGEIRLHQQNDYIHQALFWPSDELLLTCCAEFSANAQMWQTTDGSLVDTLVGPPWPDGISTMTFSQDRSMLAAVYKNSIWLWDTADRKVIQQLNRRNGQYRGGELTFMHDGQVLSMYTFDLNSLRLWDVVEGVLLADLPDQHTPVLSPDRTRLFTQSLGQIHYWDIKTKQELFQFDTGAQGIFNINDISVAFAADGDTIFIKNRFNPPQLLNAQDASVLQTFDGDGYGFVTPDGGMIVTNSHPGILTFRDARNGRSLFTLDGYNYFLFPDESTIATWDDEQIMLWNMSDSEPLHVANLPQSGMNYVWQERESGNGRIPAQYLDFLQNTAFPNNKNYESPDGNLRINFDQAKSEIIIWKNSQNGPPQQLDTIHTPEKPRLLTFLPDGQTISAVQNDTSISLWHIDGTPIITLPAYQYILDYQFSQDGYTLYATTSNNYTESLRVWELPSGNVLHVEQYSLEMRQGNTTHNCFRRPFAIGQLGNLVAYSNTQCQINIVQISDWRILHTIDPGFGYGGRMAFSPDETLLATGFQGGEIKLWDTQKGILVHSILEHDSPVEDEPTVHFAFAEDGQLLGTSANGVLRLWGIWP